MVNLGNSWDGLLQEEWTKPYYTELRSQLIKEYATQRVYPDKYHIFDCLKTVDYPDVRVVILGQDPYHGPGQAHGHSFSVMPGVRIPPSLLNIFKELQSDVGTAIPNNGYLMKWAKQGVLLLNTGLTVRERQPNSHGFMQWRLLTDRIIALLNASPRPIVFILWGAHAISKQVLITGSHHYCLTSPHPSPFSAHRGFFGSKPFSKTNAFLVAQGGEPIDWQIEDVML